MPKTVAAGACDQREWSNVKAGTVIPATPMPPNFQPSGYTSFIRTYLSVHFAAIVRA